MWAREQLRGKAQGSSILYFHVLENEAFLSKIILPLRAIAVMSSSQTFYHDIGGTVLQGKDRRPFQEVRYRSVTTPNCDPGQLFFLLAGSVDSCNIREHDSKLRWGFELWHAFEINTFMWHLE